MKRFVILFPLTLAACDPASDPGIGVTAFDGRTVSVQSPGGGNFQSPAPYHDAKAYELCPNAKYSATKKVDEYTVEFVYLC